MRRVSRKWLLIALTLCVALLLLAIPVSRSQSYRINKINFIIWDNQHENVANLSREQFTDYLQRCGARIDSAGPQWTVHYDGLFHHRAWTFAFAAPATESPQ